MEDSQLTIYDNANLMTVPEISHVLAVSESTVLRYIKKTMPSKIVNGKQTFLNEAEVTAMKLKLQQNQYLVSPDELPKTDLEKKLLIQQAIGFLNEEIDELREQVENKTKQLEEAKPKIEFHDQVGDSAGLHNMAETAKLLDRGYGRNIMMQKLRYMLILMKNNIPYQSYINSGYFEVKENFIGGDYKFVKAQTFVTPKGLIYLQKRLK